MDYVHIAPLFLFLNLLLYVIADRDHFQLGSLSHLLNAKAGSYQELPEWPETAPDPSVRNVEVKESVRAVGTVTYRHRGPLDSPGGLINGMDQGLLDPQNRASEGLDRITWASLPIYWLQYKMGSSVTDHHLFHHCLLRWMAHQQHPVHPVWFPFTAKWMLLKSFQLLWGDSKTSMMVKTVSSCELLSSSLLHLLLMGRSLSFHPYYVPHLFEPIAHERRGGHPQ